STVLAPDSAATSIRKLWQVCCKSIIEEFAITRIPCGRCSCSKSGAACLLIMSLRRVSQAPEAQLRASFDVHRAYAIRAFVCAFWNSLDNYDVSGTSTRASLDQQLRCGRNRAPGGGVAQSDRREPLRHAIGGPGLARAASPADSRAFPIRAGVSADQL